MKKYLAGIIFCSIVFAGQFSGVIVDEATGKGLAAEFFINGQKVTIASSGQYAASAPDNEPNHYLLRLPNGQEYLFIAAGQELNLQMPTARRRNRHRNTFGAEIKINLRDNQQIAEEADVSIYGFDRPQMTAVRDYHQGKAVFNNVRLAEAMYVAVSRNADLYICKLENLIPGRDLELDIDLRDFAPAGKISGAAHGAYEITDFPSAENYYLAKNVIPVYRQTLGENTLLFIGATPNFPADMSYYNAREIVYEKADGKKLTVYTDQKIDEVAGQGKLLERKYFRLKDFRMKNFSPAMLEDTQERAIWQAEDKTGEENN